MLFAACGGGGSKSGSTPAGASATGGGSDEAYLEVVCGGADNFYNALQTATTTDQLSKVIRDFIADLQKASPPADLRDFNQQFIKYLQDAVDNPTSLVSTNPPLPPDDARDRLVKKESDVEACKEPTFLDAANPPGEVTQPANSPTP
jgi:hypothetical protein